MFRHVEESRQNVDKNRKQTRRIAKEHYAEYVLISPALEREHTSCDFMMHGERAYMKEVIYQNNGKVQVLNNIYCNIYVCILLYISIMKLEYSLK